MRFGDRNGKLIAFAALLLLSTPLTAQATTGYSHAHKSYGYAVHHVAYHHSYSHYSNYAHNSNYTRYSNPYADYVHSEHFVHYGARHHLRISYRGTYSHGIQCVAFAKADSGIVLSGNAADWWDHAAGVYQRGDQPEVGAVLNFRANPRMRLGHVAVVSNVIDARTVEIDQANWGGGSSRHGGGISRSTMVVDVSPNNDWTAVRVGLDHAGDYGSIYPTYGFIYARPDDGTEVASNTTAAAPADTRNQAPSDLRRGASYDEVAEVPATSGIDTGASLGLDAPDRALQ